MLYFSSAFFFLKLLQSPQCQKYVYYKLSSPFLLKQIVPSISLAQFLKYRTMYWNHRICIDLYYICTIFTHPILSIILCYCQEILQAVWIELVTQVIRHVILPSSYPFSLFSGLFSLWFGSTAHIAFYCRFNLMAIHKEWKILSSEICIQEIFYCHWA